MNYTPHNARTPSLMSNTEKALLVLELLYRHNCRMLVISPGSRSTPLTVLAARDARFEKVVVHDERAAGGFALGYARAAGKPAALICTSGSAAANYFPAIVEASTDEIPMVVVTADRPAYLHGTGANQTMYQYGLYGEYVVDAKAEGEFASPQQYAQHLVSILPNVMYGPVHINLEFEKPLEPQNVPGATDRIQMLLQRCDCTEHDVDWVYKRGWYSSKEPGAIPFLKSIQNENGAVIVGRLASKEQVEIASSILSTLSGWPIHIDVTAHEAMHVDAEWQIRWDAWLATHSRHSFEFPRTVVHIGGKFVECEATREILSQAETCIHITPFRSVIQHQTKIHRAFKFPHSHELDPPDGMRYSRSVEPYLVNDVVAAAGSQAEIVAVHKSIKQCRSDNRALWLASSMTIRYAQALERSLHSRVFANRGVSGIDITIASACGASFATKTTVNCVLGDMAFLHDCNSLSLLRLPGVDVHLSVLNNDVGGIFHRLPIASEHDVFEKYFLTPTNIDVNAIAAAFGVADRVQEHKTRADESLADMQVARDFNRFTREALDIPFEIVGSGPKHIVFLHGFAGCPQDWLDIARRLGQEYTCIIPDLHAPSEQMAGDNRSFVSLSASLSQLLHNRRIETYGVVGYSMGGRIARYWQRVASQKADWMLLESSHPGLSSHQERLQRIEADERIARKLDLCTTAAELKSFFEAWYANSLFGALSNQPGFNNMLQQRSQQDASLLAASLRTVGLGHQPQLSLSETQCYVELVVGRLDTKFVRIAQQEHQEHGVVVHVAENASHNVHSEDPDYFVENIMNIVESVWSE